jgi:hypothetical protein
MPALTAASFVTVVQLRQRTGKRKMHRGTLTFGNGADTYSGLGIPLPAKGAFGFVRVLEDLVIDGSGGAVSDYMYRFSKASGPSPAKLQLFGDRGAAAAGLPLVEATTAEAPTARTINFVAYGW